MERKLGPKEAADHVGISVHTLRYYEKAGLLDRVPRTEGGHRLYGDLDLAALDFIVKMRSTGMGISQIRRYIATGTQGLHSLKSRERQLREHQQLLRRKREEIEQCEAILRFKLSFYSEAAAKLQSCEWAESEIGEKWAEYFRKHNLKEKTNQ